MKTFWETRRAPGLYTLEVEPHWISLRMIEDEARGGPCFGLWCSCQEFLGGKLWDVIRERHGEEVLREARAAALKLRPEASASAQVAPYDCSVCAKLPNLICADLRQGERLRDETSAFTVVGGSSENNNLRRCPVCGTYWLFSNSYEFQYEDMDSLERLAPDEALAALAPISTTEHRALLSQYSERCAEMVKCLESDNKSLRQHAERFFIRFPEELQRLRTKDPTSS